MIRSLALLLMTTGALGNDATESREEGRHALATHDHERAVDQLREALEVDPTDVESWLLLARSYTAMADQLTVSTQEDWEKVSALLTEAESALRSALDADQHQAKAGQAWAELGENLLKQGKATEAIATLYHAQQYREDDLRLLRNLGEALLMARSWAVEAEQWDQADARLAEAQTVLEKAAKVGEMQADVLRALGEVRTAQQDHASAQRSLRRAIALRPADVQLHNAYLGSLRQSKDFDAGLDFYTGLLDEPALARWYRAETLQLKGNYAFQKEKEFSAAAKDYARAEEELHASVKTNPEYRKSAQERIPYLRSYRGYALTEAGKLAEAEVAFFSALDRAPGLEHALQGLGQLMTAHYEAIGGEKGSKEDFDRLRAFAARACVVNPGDAKSWNNYAFFAREAGQYEESYQAYRRARELEPENARTLNDTALILVYHLDRDLDLAEEWLLEARDISDTARDDAETQHELDATVETFGDSLVNLVTLYYKQRRLEEARPIFDRLVEELPKRAEIKFWEKRLYPERVAEREKAAAEKAAADKAKSDQGS